MYPMNLIQCCFLSSIDAMYQIEEKWALYQSHIIDFASSMANLLAETVVNSFFREEMLRQGSYQVLQEWYNTVQIFRQFIQAKWDALDPDY